MTKLKPCPFCGGEGTYSADNRIIDNVFFAYVECDTCHCVSTYADTETQAITAWNTRQPAIDWKPIKELTEETLLKNENILFVRKHSREIILADATYDNVQKWIRISSLQLQDDFDLEEANKWFSYFAELSPPKD